MRSLNNELQAKVKDCKNTNTIFDTEKYVLLKDAEYLLNEALNMHIVGRQFKDKKTLTFDEFITEFGLEPDRDNEYYFDNDYYTFEGLYYKYAEYFNIKP